MASPGAECATRVAGLSAIPLHKTDCSRRDQQGTAGDAAKSKTWNPAQCQNAGPHIRFQSGSKKILRAARNLFRGSIAGNKEKTPRRTGALVLLNQGKGALTSPSG